MIHPAQCRAARGLTGWSRSRLSRQTGISVQEIRHFEDECGRLAPEAIERVKLSFTDAGVQFIAENGGGVGVRLRKSGRSEKGRRPDQLNASNDD